MPEKTKEKESKAVSTRPSEIVPRREMEEWFDRMFEDFWRRPFPSLFHPETWWPMRRLGLTMPAMPSVDLYEEANDVVVKAEMPGMRKEDIEISLTGDTLTLKGEKKSEEDVKEEAYRYRERSRGAFTRIITLPCEVKGDQVKASFKDGVLEMRLPKTEEAKRKTISVKID